MQYSEATLSQSQNLSKSQSEYQQMLQNYELLACDIHREFVNSSSQICVKQDCEKIFNISCNDCMTKEHSDQDHTLNDFISLKRFMSKLNQLSQSTPQCQKYDDILKPSLESLNKQVKELLIKIDLLRTELQQIIEEVAIIIGEQQGYTRKQQDQLEIIRSKQNDFYKLKQTNELNEYLKQMNELIIVKNVKRSDFNLQLQCADQENNENEIRIGQNQKLCEKSSKMLIEMDSQIMDIINKLKIFHLKVADKYFHPKLEFSETLKHPNIKIIQKDTVQQTVDGPWSFCLSESKLPMYQDSTWAFKITQSTSNCIMIGVTHPEIIQQQGFTSIFSILNEGYYFLYGSGNGFTFTHYKKEENDVGCSLGFKTGDIIYILFQPIKKKIYFCKNKNNPYVSITLSPNREDYQPCVVLLTQNDSVQMLKNDEYKFDL